MDLYSVGITTTHYIITYKRQYSILTSMVYLLVKIFRTHNKSLNHRSYNLRLRVGKH